MKNGLFFSCISLGVFSAEASASFEGSADVSSVALIVFGLTALVLGRAAKKFNQK